MIALLGISPGDGRDLCPWLEALGRAGLPGVLIREPNVDRETLDRWVGLAVDGLPFVAVHDRNPHAREIARRRGVPLHVASDTPPPPVPFAASTHSADEVDDALAAGAVYCLLSPVWSPLSKPDDVRPPLGPDRFLAIAGARPVLALGGVTPERFRVLQAAGAGAAVLGGLSDPDPMSRYLRS